jgi:branched-chain amino acid transport system substrate-binding protein
MSRARLSRSPWRRAALLAIGMAMLSAASALAADQKNYAPGITDTEIKIGQTAPYSGPASAYAEVAKAELAYFQMINDRGGVNGRKITLISLDDGYSPPKTVERTRKLVEEDGVALIFSTIGTPTNLAIRKYLNDRKVPQLWSASGDDQFSDPKRFPWTTPNLPSYRSEGGLYGRYIAAERPNAKIAVLYQNDDFGKDLLQGMRDGLGAAASLIVATASYEVTDPAVDSQIVSLQDSGADTLFIAATPKFAAQAIRKVYDVGWRPERFLNLTGNSVAAVLTPAGLEKSIGLISALFAKDPTDPQWQADAGYQDWRAWMAKYRPDGDLLSNFNVAGYDDAMALVEILRRCGDDLSRDNIMKEATHLDHFAMPMLMPGVTINTSPDNFFPIKQARLARFDGKTWTAFGGVREADLPQR